MKFLYILLILCAANAVRPTSHSTDGQVSEDPVVEDNRDILWKVLYSKLNTLLNVTEMLNQSIADLKQRQQDQEVRLINLVQNLTTNAKNYTDEKFAELEKKLGGDQDQCGPNWITIMRRQDGSVDFYRDWTDYKTGFGHEDGEFFVGLEKLHRMTTYGAPQELLVVLEDWEGETRYAKYDHFQVASEQEKYALKGLGEFSGNVGDSLRYHKDMKFATQDQDNDDTYVGNCAVLFEGAWWFRSGYTCHLFGRYRQKSEMSKSGVTWHGWKPSSLKFVEMMIQSKQR